MKQRSFLPAAILQSTYTVLGHFYDVRLSPRTVVACRSVLEISRKDCESDGNTQPDAIFIMMNPGSSAPLEFTPPVFGRKSIDALVTELVPTKPDTTQYQLMRVMHYCKFRRVRVVNLSDLCNAKSDDFAKLFQTLEREHGYTEHSIFSNGRSAELRRALQRNIGAPVIRAWGVGDRLAPLIGRCLKSIENDTPAKGLLKPSTTDRFYHPLPQTREAQHHWVNNMVVHLGRSS